MNKKKVMIGMSGGVDSSVAAALLLEQGYDVIGVTLQVWPDFLKNQDDDACCSLSAVDDARAVANTLGIPFYVMNFKNIFEDTVVKYFVNEYLNGRTPNPCIACNRYVKFGEMLRKARAMGIDYVATGHYAKIEQKSGKFYLKKSDSVTKDQTYALYNIKKEDLNSILFPLGVYTKDETRRMAEKYNLPVAHKRDSQEICFIPDDNYARFIEEYGDFKSVVGDFIDSQGNFLGKHKGYIHYTVGQRKGLGVSFGKPMYVNSIDAKNNKIILGEEGSQYSRGLIASDINLLSVDEISDGMHFNAKIRYSHREVPCTVSLENDKLKVVFEEPQRAVTPGQAVVLYDGDIVAGGAIIENSL